MGEREARKTETGTAGRPAPPGKGLGSSSEVHRFRVDVGSWQFVKRHIARESLDFGDGLGSGAPVGRAQPRRRLTFLYVYYSTHSAACDDRL